MFTYYPQRLPTFHALLLDLASGGMATETRDPTSLPGNLSAYLPKDPELYTATFIFLLDRAFTIRAVDRKGPNLFGQRFKSQPFETLVAPESKATWMRQKHRFTDGDCLYFVFSLTFTSREKILLPCYCYATKVPGAGTFLIHATAVLLLPDDPDMSHRKNGSSPHQHIYQQLLHYINTHMDCPLPPIKKLAVLLNTNECTLKKILRTEYGTTLHRLCMEERLKKSRELILQSTENLKSIAFDCGFVSYAHFSKAFKKRFGISPNCINRIPVI